MKLKNSATVRRLRFLIVCSGAGSALSFLFCVLFASLCRSAAGRVSAVLFFILFIALSIWTAALVCALVKILKRAGRYSFTVTQSASFECFGPFLAMNVSFLDEGGALREGRSRFLFGARDVEAWQNVPLEIAYIPGGEEKAGRRRRKPDLQPNAEIVVVGAAPGGKISEKNPEK